jgi:hypothetical protein
LQGIIRGADKLFNANQQNFVLEQGDELAGLVGISRSISYYPVGTQTSSQVLGFTHIFVKDYESERLRHSG